VSLFGRGAQANCYESNRKYSPIDMRGEGRTFQTSAAECQRHCDSVTGCEHFSFWNDGGCHLQDSASSAQAAGGVTAGPPNCQGENWVKVASSGWCYRHDQWSANAVAESTHAGSLTACKNFCLSKEWCKYVTFETGQVGWCVVSSACDPKNMVDDDRVFSWRYDTWSRAEMYKLFKSGAECKSSDIDMGTKASVQACAEAVQENGGHSFIFGTGPKAGRCWLENTGSQTNANTVSAMCPEGWEDDDYNFYTLRYKVVHADAGDHAVCDKAHRIDATSRHWGNLDKCTELCHNTNGCTHITYFSNDGCQLYSACDTTWNQDYEGGGITSTIHENPQVSGGARRLSAAHAELTVLV